MAGTDLSWANEGVWRAAREPPSRLHGHCSFFRVVTHHSTSKTFSSEEDEGKEEDQDRPTLMVTRRSRKKSHRAAVDDGNDDDGGDRHYGSTRFATGSRPPEADGQPAEQRFGEREAYRYGRTQQQIERQKVCEPIRPRGSQRTNKHRKRERERECVRVCGLMCLQGVCIRASLSPS